MPRLFAAWLLPLAFNFGHAQWVQTNGPGGQYVFALAVSGSNLFAGTDSGVFRTSDNGDSWTWVNNGLTSAFVTSLAVRDSILFAGISGGGVFRTSDSGDTWTQANNGLTSLAIRALAVRDSTIFAGASTDGGVFRSIDDGNSWIQVNNGLTNRNVLTLAANRTTLFVGTDRIDPMGGPPGPGGVYRSVNNGDFWSWVLPVPVFLYQSFIWALAVRDSIAFAGADDGVYRSINNGSWIQVNNGLAAVIVALTVRDSVLFAGNSGRGVYLSTNNGDSWIQVNNGLTNLQIRSLIISNSTLFAGTDGGGVWRRPLSEMVNQVAIRPSGKTPINFGFGHIRLIRLGCKIDFMVPRRGKVELAAYDAKGKKAATVVNQVLEGGRHQISFDASELSDGLYFLQLRAEGQSRTKRIVLEK